MRTIVVATDFSASAEHATLYAAALAKHIGAGVLLLHVYQMPVSMTDFPVLLISAEDLKKNADEGLRRAKEAAQKLSPAVAFETESRMGDVVEEIEGCCANKEMALLVAGTKNLTGFERFLSGDTALAIAKNSHFPVIVVPEETPVKIPKKLALAVADDDKIPAQKIKMFVDLMSAELHIVHVQTGDDAAPIQLPEALQAATYHVHKETDVSEGLQHFIVQENIDLLVILPHKHNLMKRIFFKGHTSELINEMKVPVMCIQEMSNE